MTANPPKLRSVALALLISAQLGGCAWVKQAWPWRKKEVPVTESRESGEWPEEAGSSPPTETEAPATQPAEPPRPESVEPRPDAEGPVDPGSPVAGDDPPAPLTTGGEVVTAVLLRVNDRFYTVEDVISIASLQLAALEDDVPVSVWRLRAEAVLTETIRQEVGNFLVYQEAKDEMADEQRAMLDAQVENRLKELIAQHGGSEQRLREALREQGTTLDEALEIYRRDLIVKSYLRSKFEPKIEVGRRDLWLYYRRHPEEFSTPKRVAMQIIAAPDTEFDADEGPPHEQARAAILGAKDALDAGRPFDEVAREHSRGIKADEGGLWPMAKEGSFRLEAVEAAAFELPEGGVSDVIETDGGYYIVQAAEVAPERTQPFTKAQEEIRYKLESVRHNELAAEYFQELSETAVVVQNDELMPLAVDRAVERFYRE